MENQSVSVDLGTYRFTGAHQQGMAPIDSFDHTIATTPSTSAQFAQSAYFYAPSSGQLPLKIQNTKEAAPQLLTWRLDPDESLSDWTLTVVSNLDLEDNDSDQPEDDNDSDDEKEEERDEEANPSSPRLHNKKTTHHPTTKYFVHRTQLAVGPRRSEYFAKLFRQNTKRNTRSSTGTRIELRPSAAAAFPAMLDFLYAAVGSPPNTTTESAVALRHLAACFGIRELFECVTAFIKADLAPETAPTYLVEANAFSHDKLQDAALKTCAQNFEIIKFSRIVTLTPPLLEQVVTSPLLQSSSRVLSSRVASYCRCRPGLVDATMLQLLTGPDRMPEIAPEESLFFLHLISEVDEEADDESLGGRRLSGKHSLYNRCLEASAQIVRVVIASKDNASKKKVSTPTRNAAKEYYSLPSTMKVDLLEHALSVSPTMEDYLFLEQARKEAKKKHDDENNQQLQQLQTEMAKMRRKYEKKLASQEARIVAQEQEVSAYARELSKFTRVPNDHDIPTVRSEYTFASIPAFDDYGDSVFGEVPPTALPRFGDRHGEDGWVYHEDRWLKKGQRKSYCWPMYIYKGK